MLTYAFIANSETLNPDDYNWEYENDEMKFRFFITSDMETNKKIAKELADDGFEYLDLCGDFDDEMTKEISNAAGGRLEVAHAGFSEEEESKFNSLEKMDEYGLIIMAEGLESGAKIEHRITSCEFNTTINIVSNDDVAIAAAKDLSDRGIDFIEFCSYFDAAKTADIIAATGGKTPIGSCGE